jgi:hypothetical protein
MVGMPRPGDLGEIARLLAEATIHPVLVERVNDGLGEGERRIESVPELLSRLDSRLARRLCEEILPSLKVLDPACGSGVFLAAALETLAAIYRVVIAKCGMAGVAPSDAVAPGDLPGWIRRRILADNLFGVDLSAAAIAATRRRLLASTAGSEPVPDLDFHLHLFQGNSLLGLLHVDDGDFERRQPGLFRRTFRQALSEKTEKTGRSQAGEGDEATVLDLQLLDLILLDEWQDVPYEQATWDRAKNQPGRPVKRPVCLADVRALRPFHWAYELDAVLGERGGFDVILTDPPWETVKPQVEEFLAEAPAAATLAATPKELEREPTRLGQNRETREAWLAYLSRFPHLALYFRTSPQYNRPIAATLGRKAGTDLHWDELFLARSFRLLRPGGRSGFVLPTSFYADPALKSLRETLFARARVEILFGLSNERALFTDAEIERGFRLAVLVFARGLETESFQADFKTGRKDALPAGGLEDFWRGPHLRWSWNLVQRLAPGSLVVPEDKHPLDLVLLEKIFRFETLESEGPETWNLRLDRGFDSTKDSYLFRNAPGAGRLPLYEGRMIGPFTAEAGAPRYWLEEDEARRALLGRKADVGQGLEYQGYRLGFRDGARSAAERPLVVALLPPGVFANDRLPTAVPRTSAGGVDLRSTLFLSAVLNSLVVGYLLRQRANSSVTFPVLSQVPVPHPEPASSPFSSLVELAARLTAVSAEFAGLWESAMGTFWFPPPAATDPAERARLAAEIDGRVAHLYGLTEEELAHVLKTFPTIEEAGRTAVLAAYRELG